MSSVEQLWITFQLCVIVPQPLICKLWNLRKFWKIKNFYWSFMQTHLVVESDLKWHEASIETSYRLYLTHLEWILMGFVAEVLTYLIQFCFPNPQMNWPQVYVPPSWIPLPSPSPPYPSELSQNTSFTCPASCIE